MSEEAEKELAVVKQDIKMIKEALLGTEFNHGGIIGTLQEIKKDLRRLEDCECEEYQERIGKLENKGITYELYVRFLTFIFAVALTAYIGSTIKNILADKHEKPTSTNYNWTTYRSNLLS